MKTNLTFSLSIVAATLLSCSSFDFLQYRENTGLYAVEKPDDYSTMSFGMRIAASGDDSQDYMAVSGGEGTSTLFYQLSEGDKLKTVSSDMQDFPAVLESAEAADAVRRGSGASLTGLPIFAINQTIERGCMAVGEPGMSQVTVWCSRTDKFYTIKGGGDNFGTITAPIRLGGGSQFLLIVGATDGFEVFSDIDKDSDNLSEFKEIAGDASLWALAGGRIIDRETEGEILYVAAATDDGVVHLYLQSSSNGKSFYQAACIDNSKNNGFGGAMASGDLDGDGADELVIGSNPTASNLDNKVQILDVAQVIDSDAFEGWTSDEDCIDIGDDIPVLAVIKPDDGDLDVQCESEDCGFGSALTVGDISLDDDGPELIVGAFGATADGVSGAGAVYIYRGWERTDDDGEDLYDDWHLAGQVADSTPESGKEFGRTLAIAPIAGRNELLISATGEGRVFVAFCTGVGDNINDGADVPRDENGNSLSTRCRL